MSQAPAGLYLHVPFCRRICPYCDFAVRTGDRDRRRNFVEHLIAEIRLHADCALEFDTVYFGGGTPSMLEADDLARIVEAARGTLRIAKGSRIFLEANPEDVTAESTAAWRSLGVVFLSLGLQSLDERNLAFLGRMHGADGAREAVARALDAGFHTVSVDLIFGLPDQRPSDWRHQLDRAAELGAQHLSCYQLTIHERTRFGLLEKRGRLTQLPDDEQAKLFELTHRHLAAAGFQGYEVSNFASKPEHRSRHNLKYWDHTSYLGLGPSAHSFVDGTRWWNLRRTDPWQERVAGGERPIEGSETLDARTLALEALMLGLRTCAGVDLERLHARWGIDLLAANRGVIRELEERGLAHHDRGRLVPTLAGLAVADSLPPRFEIPAAS